MNLRQSCVCFIAAGLLVWQPAWAQFPERAIKIVVPYAPGGGTDTVSRLLGHKLSESVKQSVIIDNRPGGSTITGSQLVVKSPPDGYTMLFGSTSQALNVSLFPKLPYDPLKDLAAVTLLGTSPQILVVNPSLPVRTVKELIALAKGRKDQLTFASGGIASINQLAGELFKLTADVDMIHVPYKGGGPAVIDLLAGRVDVYFSSLPSALKHVQAGKLRALGITGGRRSKAAPDVPTISEAALPGYELLNWYALFVPGGTARDVVTRLNSEIVRIVKDPEIAAKLAEDGFEPVGSTPQELDAFLKAEITKNAAIVRKANIKPE